MALLFQALPVAAVWMWIRPEAPLSIGTRLATALGLGLSSALFFLWRLAGGSPQRFAIADPMLWALAWVAAVARVRTSPATPPQRAPRVSAVALALLALVVVGASAARAWIRLAAAPFGEWDAWAIWNLRARFLAESSPFWRSVFTPELDWRHPDYPLLRRQVWRAPVSPCVAPPCLEPPCLEPPCFEPPCFEPPCFEPPVL